MSSSRAKVALGAAGAAAVALGIYVASQNASSATQCYVDQFGATVIANPNAAGRTSGIGPAHGTCIIGLDGVCYGLVDQEPIAGPETRYQRPGPNAGEKAQRWSDFYWTGEEFRDADGKWHTNRCYFLPAGRIAGDPPASVAPCINPIPKVPRSARAAGAFNPALFVCGGSVTPTVTPAPGGGCGCVTPTPTPCSQVVCTPVPR